MSGKIDRYLENKTVVYLDTAPIIYFIQEDAQYLPAVQEVFSRIDQGFVSAISSYITLIELLAKPLELKEHNLACKYRDLLIGSPCFTLYPVERTVSEKAAELKAKYASKFKKNGSFLRTPDAIQIATALSFGAQLFITNDLALRKIQEIQILTLGELL